MFPEQPSTSGTKRRRGMDNFSGSVATERKPSFDSATGDLEYAQGKHTHHYLYNIKCISHIFLNNDTLFEIKIKIK